jgi:hypothetical protein
VSGDDESYDYDNAGQMTSRVEPNGNAAGATPAGDVQANLVDKSPAESNFHITIVP